MVTKSLSAVNWRASVWVASILFFAINQARAGSCPQGYLGDVVVPSDSFGKPYYYSKKVNY